MPVQNHHPKPNVGTKLNYIENRLYKYRVRVVSKIVVSGSKYEGNGDGRGRRCMRSMGITTWIRIRVCWWQWTGQE
jgi:hypothetical protein